jgi:hypothetical protein
MKKIFFFLFIIFFPFTSWAQPPEVKPEEVVTLIVSANVFGEYEPCG